jgi:anaerobic ribonucleoside-triphosphate reductase
MQNNVQAVLALMKHIYNTIMYAELNTKSDYCQVCGYTGEIQIVGRQEPQAGSGSARTAATPIRTK